MEPRTRLSAQDRRMQLLEVAGTLFAQHGFHGLSMEQLADAAGVSKPVLYQHFPSKRDLYLALVHDAIAEMESQVRKALEGTRDNRARVEGAISAYFDFVEDRRFRLVFGAFDAADPDVRDAVDEANRRTASAVGRLIAEDAGLEPEAAGLLATALRGLATEAARWWMDHDDVELQKVQAVTLLSRLAWRGLGSFQKD